jgi:putative phage-type endonuclease
MDLLDQVEVDASDPELRRTGIGGSDAAAILGLSDYRTRYGVACEKIYGITEERDEAAEERLDLGKDLEPVVRRAFERKTGLRVAKGEAFVRHPDHPFIYANVDGLIDAEVRERWLSIVPPEIQGPGIFEGKCASGGSVDPWGTPADQRVPVHYWVQGQHYMLVTGRAWVGYGCLANAAQILVRFVLRDDAWIERVLLPGLVAFWRDVEAGDPGVPVDPDLDTPVLRQIYDGAAQDVGDRVRALEEDIKAARKDKAKDRLQLLEAELRRLLNKSTLALTDEQTREVYRWAAVATELDDVTAREKALEIRVREIMGEYAIGELTTGEIITYKTTSNGQRRLRAPHASPGKRR